MECCNFNQFDKFRDFIVENGRGKNLTPNPNERIKLILFPKNCLRLMQHGHLETRSLQIKGLTKKQCKNILPIFTHLLKYTKQGLQHIQVIVKHLLFFYWVSSLELWVNYTKNCHKMMLREVQFKFCNKAPRQCTLTFIFNFVDGLIENILGDMLQICSNIKVRLVKKVFPINKGKRKINNIGTSI